MDIIEAVGQELKTFMKRDDIVFDRDKIKSERNIYHNVNEYLLKSDTNNDISIITRQIKSLFENRKNYLMISTSQQMCNVICSFIEDKDDARDHAYVLFSKISGSHRYDSSSLFDIADNYSCNKLCYCKTLNDKFSIEFQKIDKVFKAFFLEAMSKAEIIFNIFMQSPPREYYDEYDPKLITDLVTIIADTYDYIFTKLLVEWICIYYPHINEESSVETDTFLYIMKVYNSKCKHMEDIYSQLKI